MITQKQQDAVYAKVEPELIALVRQYIPMFFQEQALSRLSSPEGKAEVVRVLDDAINAAEAAK